MPMQQKDKAYAAKYLYTKCLAAKHLYFRKIFLQHLKQILCHLKPPAIFSSAAYTALSHLGQMAELDVV